MSKGYCYYSIRTITELIVPQGGIVKTQLLTTLTLAVTVILLVFLNSQRTSSMVELTVLIVLVVLIMVVGGADRELPEVLRAILGSLRRR